MRLGLLLELPTQRENVELARRAEAAGFDSAWAPEFHNHSGVLALAAAALETERIELGTGIAWAFGRSPLLTAVTALDLDEMSGGRFVLGLGTGTRRMRTHWLGAPAERPATRLRETIEAVREVWKSAQAGAVRYDGELVQLDVRPYGRADQVRDDIPVYVAAVNEGMARIAGAVADGVVAHPMATPRYIDEVMRPAIDRGRATRRSRRVGGRGGGLGDRGRVRRRRTGARGRQAPDRLPRHRAHLRPDPGAARVRRRRRADQRAVAELRPGRDDRAGHRRDARRDGGRRHRRTTAARRSSERAAAADRLLLGAPVVATDPDRIRDYHDAIVETFGTADPADCAGARLRALMEGWTIFYMVVIIKIPMVAALWLVWWAIKNEPTPEEETGEDRGPRRKRPPLPRWPRRGPAGGGGAGCKPPPCPQTTVVRPARTAPVYARRAGTEASDRPIR